MTTSPEEVANRTTEQFADKIFQAALGTMETLNLYLGDQLGWFDALAAASATAGELAEQTKTQPRYAIEWLEMQAVYGNVTVIDDGAQQRCSGLMSTSPRSKLPTPTPKRQVLQTGSASPWRMGRR